MLDGWTIKRVPQPVKSYPAHPISHALSRGQSGGSAAYLRAVFGLIVCQEARFTIASSSPCTPTSPFYKRRDIERPNHGTNRMASQTRAQRWSGGGYSAFRVR